MTEDAAKRLSLFIQAEEKQRAEYAKNHAGACVPWRGRDGVLGACIYCGKQADAITAYYADRANSGLAALAK